MNGDRARRRRHSKPRRGSRVYVESLNSDHWGKVVAVTPGGGEAVVKWDNGEETIIDTMDLHRPDGTHFYDR